VSEKQSPSIPSGSSTADKPAFEIRTPDGKPLRQVPLEGEGGVGYYIIRIPQKPSSEPPSVKPIPKVATG
jgi:hypothetical protein